MKLARFDGCGGSGWGVVREDGVIDLEGLIEPASNAIQTLLGASGRRRLAAFVSSKAKVDRPFDERTLAPFIPESAKIICVGVNYPERNKEYQDGSQAPAYPSLFIRVANSFVAHGEALVRPPESEQFDYEGEIAVVIGEGGRRISRANARSHIAGVTIVNDGTMRDWVRHAKFNVTQGKNFDLSGAIGPWMVTIDEFENLNDLTVQTRVNGELRQSDSAASMIFPIDYLIEYISHFTTLRSGDVISTGTPVGAGARLTPPCYLRAGDIVEVSVSRVGTLRNEVVDEQAAAFKLQPGT